MAAPVEIDEVQANVLYGYGLAFGHALHIRFQMEQSPNAGHTVAGWLREVSFGNQRPPGDAEAEDREAAFEAPVTHVNVALSPRGLAALGVREDYLRAFPQDFRDGARERARSLGDGWDVAAHDDADVLLSIHGRAAEHCDWRARELLPDADSGLRELCRRPTARQRGNVEAFGFADGRSQPAIEGVDTHAVGDGVYANRVVAAGGLLRRLGAAAESAGLKRKPRGWRLIRAGEFLLGYENEDGVLPPGPPAPLGPNGTYMVYRELDQNKAAFDDYVEKTARAHRIGERQLGAKIVGRWQDGTPVARVPDDPDVTVSHRRANDFRYEDDLDGFGCPLGAHVRRANPRDGLPGGAERTMRHRIIRRGMPYEGGLAFICFSASIENGFEFIQREWINDGTVFGLDGPDFLLQQRNGDGRPHGRMVIPGYRTIVLQPPDEPFVTVQGCDYLFVPSRRACAWLADLAEAR